MKKQLYTIAALLIMGITANAQVGIGTTTPNATSALDITSTTAGLLIPRMTTTQRGAIATPATGLQVFDITTNSPWYFNGTVWTNGAPTASTNIYNADGTLTGNRIVTTGANNLTFAGTTGRTIIQGAGGSITPLTLQNTQAGGNVTTTLTSTDAAANVVSLRTLLSPTLNTKGGFLINGSNLSSIFTQVGIYGDFGTGNVGFNNSAPAGKLTVSSYSSSLTAPIMSVEAYATPNVLRMYGLNGTIDAPVATGTLQGIGIISFQGYNGTAPVEAANISSTTAGAFSSSNKGADLRFSTTTTATTTLTERMRITDAGNVGIGTTSPTTTLQVNGSISGKTAFYAGGSSVTATVTDYYVATSGSGALAYALPAPGSFPGRTLILSASVGTTINLTTPSGLIFSTTGSNTSATTQTLAVNKRQTMISDGANWLVISQF